jgi:hypothetical protein
MILKMFNVNNEAPYLLMHSFSSWRRGTLAESRSDAGEN